MVREKNCDLLLVKFVLCRELKNIKFALFDSKIDSIYPC